MPRFRITHPDGRTVVVEGASAPTEQDAMEIFASMPAPKADADGAPAGDPQSHQESSPRRRALDVMGEDRYTRERRALQGTEADRAKLTNRGSLGLLADMAMEGGGAAAGQIAGAYTGPAAPIAIPVLGAVGGAVGNYGAQKRRIAAGEQEGLRYGQLAGSALVGAIPGSPLAATGGRTLAKEAVKQGAAGLSAKTLETAIDEGRLPTATEAALVTALPAVAGAAAQSRQLQNPVVAAAAADAAKVDALRRATLEAGKEAGYVLPPSVVNPTALNRGLESLGGKAAIGQDASLRNQKVTNALAKEAIGAPAGEEITQTMLRDLRNEAAEPYRQIAALSPQATIDLDALKQTRFDAQAWRRHYEVSADPSSLKKSTEAEELADMFEKEIEAHAVAGGRPELAAELKVARQKIAKAYEVERALNLATGEVSAPILGRALDKGKPLSGELETIGMFAESFPSAVREGSKVPTPGVSSLGLGYGALLGATTAGLTQSPYGALAGLLPLSRDAARTLVLSKPYQKFATQLPLAASTAKPDMVSTVMRTGTQQAAQDLPRFKIIEGEK